MALGPSFVYPLDMNGHQALVDEAIELYHSLGHTVEQVAEIDELRSDLLIQSSDREKWVARSDSTVLIRGATGTGSAPRRYWRLR